MVSQETAYMDAQIAQHTIKAHLREIRGMLDRAAAIARAAEACSEAGEIGQAVGIANDAEQLLYEVNTLINSASLINRLTRT
jgi:hypothetical protein